ncbi:MAG: ATP-binding protein, partial [Desulfohalobium sp.]
SRLEHEWARGDLETAMVQAEQASKAKTQFLANMSHELRTPLHGVLGCLQLLDTENLDSGDAELVRMAQQSGNTLLQLINDILELTDNDDSGENAQEHPFSVAEEFDLLTQVFSYQLQEKGLSLQTHVDAAVPTQVVGNVYRLRQVLLKLVDNAIKFSPQGTVRVAASVLHHVADERIHSYLTHSSHAVSFLITVSDEGIGLDDDALDRIFGVFTQGEMALTRTYSGTGLGLSMVKKSVEAMRGHLAIDNSGPGIVVYMHLPFSLP